MKVTCPSCAATSAVRPALAGKRMECPRCKYRFVIEAPPAQPEPSRPAAVAPTPRLPVKRDFAEEFEEHPVKKKAGGGVGRPAPSAEAPVKKKKAGGRRFADLFAGWRSWRIWEMLERIQAPVPIVVALAWMFLGLCWALVAPWLSPSGAFNVIPLLVTAGVIGWNLVAAVVRVGRSGQMLAALPFTLLQVPLFALLFFQIASHLGASHYQWEETPRWWNWLGFTAAHAVRAGDLFDTFQAYGWRVQSIAHRSGLTAGCLIAYHLILDVFLLSLITASIARLHNRSLRIGTGLAFGLMLALWIAVVGYHRKSWQTNDMALWPVEQVLRVVDFFDLMELYHVRLVNVPAGLGLGSAVLVFRLACGLLVLAWFGKLWQTIRVNWLGGVGMGREQLEELLDHDDATIREFAETRLARLPREARPALSESRSAWLALAGYAVVLFLIGLLIERWDRAAARLAKTAVTPDDPAAERAFQSLQRMGSYAEAAVPVLTESLPRLPRRQQFAAVDTLGRLGNAAVPSLDLLVGGSDDELAIQAVRALGTGRSKALSSLTRWRILAATHGLREAAHNQLLARGPEASRLLIESLTDDNLGWHWTYLERGDPYWSLYPSSYPTFSRIQAAYRRLGEKGLVQRASLLMDPRFHTTEFDVREALPELIELGPAALPVVKHLAIRTMNADVLRFFKSVGPAAVPVLLDQAVNPHPEMAGFGGHIDSSLLRLLAELGPSAAPAVPFLQQRLLDGQSLVDARLAAEALNKIDSAALDKLVPALAARLKEGSSSARASVATALASMGPAAAEAVPGLIQALSDREPYARTAVIDALGRLGPAASAAVPALIRRMKDPEVDVRLHAAEALGQIGPRASAAVPALIALGSELQQDPIYNGQAPRIAAALSKIDPDWRKR